MNNLFYRLKIGHWMPDKLLDTFHTIQTPKTNKNHIQTMKMNTFVNFQKCS